MFWSTFSHLKKSWQFPSAQSPKWQASHALSLKQNKRKNTNSIFVISNIFSTSWKCGEYRKTDSFAPCHPIILSWSIMPLWWNRGQSVSIHPLSRWSFKSSRYFQNNLFLLLTASKKKPLRKNLYSWGISYKMDMLDMIEPVSAFETSFWNQGMANGYNRVMVAFSLVVTDCN